MALNFEWDQKKAIKNLKKHGIPFEEAETVFGDPFSLTLIDPYHTVFEIRFITIGMTLRRRLLVVVHSDREGNLRLISSREATTQARIVYEEDKESE